MERVFTQTFGVVAAIIEKDGKILLVQEAKDSARGLWNHPAGWIEVGEDPAVAVVREVKEETGYDFEPTHLLGVYSLWKGEGGSRRQAIKITFLGKISGDQVALADDVLDAKWFTPEEIYAMEPNVLRDLDIKQMVRDYFADQKFELGVLMHTVSD